MIATVAVEMAAEHRKNRSGRELRCTRCKRFFCAVTGTGAVKLRIPCPKGGCKKQNYYDLANLTGPGMWPVTVEEPAGASPPAVTAPRSNGHAAEAPVEAEAPCRT